MSNKNKVIEPKWYKIKDRGTKEWNDDGEFYCKDFDYFYLCVFKKNKVYKTEMVRIDGALEAVIHGLSAKSLKEAKSNAETLAYAHFERLAAQLGLELKFKVSF